MHKKIIWSIIDGMFSNIDTAPLMVRFLISLTLSFKSHPHTMNHCNQIAQTLEVQKLKYCKIRKENQCKRDLLELTSEMNGGVAPIIGTIFSQVVKRKGWTEVNKELEQKVLSFVENHPNVVQSPIMNMIMSQ